MQARRLGFPPLAGEVSANNVPGDLRFGRWQTSRQKSVELPQRLRFGAVVIASCTLEVQEPLQDGGDRAREWLRSGGGGGRHDHTSACERATPRRVARSTLAYSIVVSVDTWPMRSPIVFMGQPAASNRVANVCRSK